MDCRYSLKPFHAINLLCGCVLRTSANILHLCYMQLHDFSRDGNIANHHKQGQSEQEHHKRRQETKRILIFLPLFFSFLFFHPSFSFLCLFIYLPASLSVCFCVQRETTHAHKVQTCFRRISEVSSTHDAAVIFFLSNNSVSFSSLTADLRASDPNIGSRYADLSGLVL